MREAHVYRFSSQAAWCVAPLPGSSSSIWHLCALGEGFRHQTRQIQASGLLFTLTSLLSQPFFFFPPKVCLCESLTFARHKKTAVNEWNGDSNIEIYGSTIMDFANVKHTNRKYVHNAGKSLAQSFQKHFHSIYIWSYCCIPAAQNVDFPTDLSCVM